MFDVVVQEAAAIDHVLEAIDESIVGGWRLARAGLSRRTAALAVLLVGRADGTAERHQSSAIRRPFEADDSARQVGQATRLTSRAIQGQQVDLGHVLSFPDPGGVGGRRRPLCMAKQ